MDNVMGAEIYDARIRPSGINKTGSEIHYFNKIGINKITKTYELNRERSNTIHSTEEKLQMR